MKVDYPLDLTTDNLKVMAKWHTGLGFGVIKKLTEIRMTKEQWDTYALNIREDFRKPQIHNGEPAYSYRGIPVKVRQI